MVSPPGPLAFGVAVHSESTVSQRTRGASTVRTGTGCWPGAVALWQSPWQVQVRFFSTSSLAWKSGGLAATQTTAAIPVGTLRPQVSRGSSAGGTSQGESQALPAPGAGTDFQMQLRQELNA